MIHGRRVFALLLLGGRGTRLWPLSSEQCPKQFLKLFGSYSLFQHTIRRLADTPIDDVVIITNAAYEQQVLAQTAELGLPPPQFVLEPFRRDSGPAIAAGVAAVLARAGPEAVVAALPADHLIPDAAHFGRTLGEALELACQDFLVTFGIRPTFPSTEYGYIQKGARLDGHTNAFKVSGFHEKPDEVTAQTYVRARTYDWNSGMFCFSAGLFTREATRHMPDIWTAAQKAVASGDGSQSRLLLAPEVFEQIRRISIDFALFEKSECVAIIPTDLEWSDVGNWASVYDALDKDPSGNVVLGRAQIQDSSGCLVAADGVSLHVVGINDFVVVGSSEGTFVAPRHRAAVIKSMIEF